MDVCYQVGDLSVHRIQRRMGYLPVMVKSRVCHLRHMSRPQLVAVKEESTEMGGYFVCNGIERIIRLLIQQRRHYIMALKRGSYQKRGANYTDMATLIRWAGNPSKACLRGEDFPVAQSGVTLFISNKHRLQLALNSHAQTGLEFWPPSLNSW